MQEIKKEELTDTLDKACSMLVGIPKDDVTRLRAKTKKIHDSVLQTLYLLRDLCESETKYAEFLFKCYFDYCFEFMSAKDKIDALIDIAFRSCIVKDPKYIEDFRKIVKDELEVMKNGRPN